MAQDLARVEQLLAQLLLPDTTAVQNASATLTDEFYSSPTSLILLIRILTTSSNPNQGIRQLAGVEARKLVRKLWEKTDEAHKPEIRTRVLEFTLSEESKLLRHSAARLIAEIASHDFEDGQWSDLPSILLQAANSPTAQHREMGLYIIYALMEGMSDFLTDDYRDLIAVLRLRIADPESADVRVNSLLILGEIAVQLEVDENPDTVASFQECVPSMVEVLKDTIATGDEDKAMQCFEVFQDVVMMNSVFFQKQFADLIRFMLELAGNDQVDQEFRLRAVFFLSQSVSVRKMRIQGLRLGEEITLKMLHLVTEMEEFGEEGERNPASQALVLLDLLASSLPPNQVVLPLLKAVGEYANNSDPKYRQAGILALGMCVEGAPDFFSSQLKELMPMVLQLLQDPDTSVRAAALKGVARLADDLADDIGIMHETLIPAIVKNFDIAIRSLPASAGKEREDNVRIVLDSCIALDSMVDGLDQEDIAKYIDQLVPRLSTLLQQDHFKMKIVAISAIGSIAASSQTGFLPYFEDAMQGLGPYITAKDSSDELELRKVVSDAMGKIALAVGSGPFERYVRPLMEASEEALHLDDERLRESSYILWSHMAKVYEEKFEPYLAGVVKGLFDSLGQDETEKLDAETEQAIAKIMSKINGGKNGDDDFELDSDAIDKILAKSNGLEVGTMVDDEDSDGDIDLSPATAVGMEKEIAVEALGDVITHTKEKFLPYLEKTIEVVLRLVEHPYYGVRQSSIGTLWRAYGMLWQISTDRGMEPWKAGIPLKVQPSDDIQKLGQVVMQATLGMWPTETERNTVIDINRNIDETLKLGGPAILVGQNVIAQVCNQLLNVITKQHACQVDEDEDDYESHADLEESSEWDWLVVETALDALTSLAKALGPDFAELWKLFEKPVLKHISSTDSNERAVATGTMAECILAMESAVTPYTSSLMKVALHRFGDEDTVTKANAIYATGLLCQWSDNDQFITKQYATILTKLEPLLADGTTGHLLDNAAGCVARLILAHPQNVPLQEVIPRLVELVPAKEDHEVNGPIFRCFVWLYQNHDATITRFTPQVITAAKALLADKDANESLDDESRGQVQELVRYLESL